MKKNVVNISIIIVAALGLCIGGAELLWPGIIGYVAEKPLTAPQGDTALYTVEDNQIPLAGPGTAKAAAAKNSDRTLTHTSAEQQYLAGVQNNGALRVEAGRLVNENGEPFQLRSMSSHGIAWFPEYTNASAIKSTKAHGANVFRITMYVDEDEGNYNGNFRDKRKNTLAMYTAVNRTLRLDMYAIIDWHILKQGNPLDRLEDAISFFDTMSRQYADKPGVIYEICNEPNGDVTWDDVYAYAQEVIPVIRANAPEAIIIVGTPDHATNVQAAMAKPLPYDNVMYAYHYYSSYAKGGYEEVLTAAMEAEFPVFISEWGLGSDGQHITLELSHAQAFVAFVNAHGISWVNWSLTNKEESFAAIKPWVHSLGDWTYDDLTTSGQLAFTALGYQPQAGGDDKKSQN